jgi:hypothetical protein
VRNRQAAKAAWISSPQSGRRLIYW